MRACQAAPFVLGEYRTLAEAYRDQRTRVAVAQARIGAVGRGLAAVGAAATYGALLLMLQAAWVPLAVAGAAGEVTAPDAITLRGVGFAYPGGEPCLHGVDMAIRRGRTVALVGENGSGKTTLAKLIAGLYRPATGSIDWDGVDVAQFHPIR